MFTNVPALDHYVYANAMVLLLSIKFLPFWLSSAKIVLSVLTNEYLTTEEYEYESNILLKYST